MINIKIKNKKKYFNLSSKIVIQLLKHEQQIVVQKYKMEYNGM